jgi:hypothetical protein
MSSNPNMASSYHTSATTTNTGTPLQWRQTPLSSSTFTSHSARGNGRSQSVTRPPIGTVERSGSSSPRTSLPSAGDTTGTHRLMVLHRTSSTNHQWFSMLDLAPSGLRPGWNRQWTGRRGDIGAPSGYNGNIRHRQSEVVIW